MLLNTFLQRTSNLFAENRLLKFVVVVQGLTLFWCVYKIDSIKDRIRTVIQPPVINSKIEVSGSWTSDAYVKEYIRYIGALLWNYSPAVARNQYEELMVSWHPSNYEAAKQRLYVLADQIERTQTSSVFYISGIKHNSNKRLIEVTGNRRLTMQDKSVENAVKTYVLSYTVTNGRFWILGIEEKVDDKKTGSPAAQPQVTAIGKEEPADAKQ